MADAKINFTKLIQDSQEYGSDDQHMVSRAFFSIEVEGNKPVDSYVDIKQTVGTDFETAKLEVSSPSDYEGPYNYMAMRQLAEHYYRSLVGKSGSGISIQGGSNIRMSNNTFSAPFSHDIEVGKECPAW